MAEKTYTTKEIADNVGINKSTLQRWIKRGWIKDATYRDGRGWRAWTEADLERVMAYKKLLKGGDEK